MAKSTVAILRTTPATAIRDGYPDVGTDVAQIEKTGSRALLESIGILGTCIREAPEFASRRRAKDAAKPH